MSRVAIGGAWGTTERPFSPKGRLEEEHNTKLPLGVENQFRRVAEHALNEAAQISTSESHADYIAGLEVMIEHIRERQRNLSGESK